MHPVLVTSDWEKCQVDDCTTFVRPGNVMCLQHKFERNKQMDEEWGIE